MSAYGFGGMIKKLKANPKTIVFTEGTEMRMRSLTQRRMKATTFAARRSSIPLSMTALKRWSTFSAN